MSCIYSVFMGNLCPANIRSVIPMQKGGKIQQSAYSSVCVHVLCIEWEWEGKHDNNSFALDFASQVGITSDTHSHGIFSNLLGCSYASFLSDRIRCSFFICCCSLFVFIFAVDASHFPLVHRRSRFRSFVFYELRRYYVTASGNESSDCACSAGFHNNWMKCISVFSLHYFQFASSDVQQFCYKYSYSYDDGWWHFGIWFYGIYLWHTWHMHYYYFGCVCWRNHRKCMNGISDRTQTRRCWETWSDCLPPPCSEWEMEKIDGDWTDRYLFRCMPACLRAANAYTEGLIITLDDLLYQIGNCEEERAVHSLQIYDVFSEYNLWTNID